MKTAEELKQDVWLDGNDGGSMNTPDEDVIESLSNKLKQKDSLLKEAEELLQQLQYELDLSKCSDDRIKQTLSKLKER